jgi:hypothetical protein
MKYWKMYNSRITEVHQNVKFLFSRVTCFFMTNNFDRAKADALANCSVLGIVALVRYILEHLEHVVVSLGQSTVRVRTLKFVYEKKSPPQQLAVRIAATIDIIAERAQAGSCWDMPADWGQTEAQDGKARQLCHEAAQALGATTESFGEGRARYVRVTFPTV